MAFKRVFPLCGAHSTPHWPLLPSLLKSFSLFTPAHPWDLSWNTNLCRDPDWPWRQGRSLVICLNSAVWPLTSASYMYLCNYLVYICFPIECEHCEGCNLISGYPLGLEQYLLHNRHLSTYLRNEGINDVMNPELWENVCVDTKIYIIHTQLHTCKQTQALTWGGSTQQTKTQYVCNLH